MFRLVKKCIFQKKNTHLGIGQIEIQKKMVGKEKISHYIWFIFIII
jgi:hypothetical protein